MLSNSTPFVSQSVITMQFVALSHPDGGRSVMKLIEFSPQMRLGIDSGQTTCAALPYQVVVSSSDSKHVAVNICSCQRVNAQGSESKV
jgi:hypothetical protein